MKMEKTMKVTIGGKTVIVSDPYRKESIKDILIFGGSGGDVEKEKVSLPGIGDEKKPTLKKRKVVCRERAYWTPEEKEKLKRLALRGMPVPEMTVIFKKKYANINNKIRGLGIQEEYRRAKTYRRDEERRITENESPETDKKKIETDKQSGEKYNNNFNPFA